MPIGHTEIHHRPHPTTTVTTVAPPAYAPAAGYDVGVEFDGVEAFYSGPAEVTEGSTITFTFITTVPDGVLAVSRLDPAPTWDTVVADVVARAFARPPAYVKATVTQVGPGAFTMTLHEGMYAVFAGVSMMTPAGMHAAILIRVTAKA